MHQGFQVATVFVMSASCLMAKAETLTWNVRAKYGVTAEGIQTAVGEAKTHFDKAPNDVVILEFEVDSSRLNS